MKKALILGLGILAFVLLLVYLTVGGSRRRVRVCVSFRGRTECRVASGASAEEAERTATQNACTLLASGMTDSMACERTRPDKVEILTGE